MTDSGIKNLGKVEYDNQIYLWRQKIQVRLKNSNWALPRIATENIRSTTKKFPTKALLKMIDSSIKNLGEVEYDN